MTNRAYFIYAWNIGDQSELIGPFESAENAKSRIADEHDWDVWPDVGVIGPIPFEAIQRPELITDATRFGAMMVQIWESGAWGIGDGKLNSAITQATALGLELKPMTPIDAEDVPAGGFEVTFPDGSRVAIFDDGSEVQPL